MDDVELFIGSPPSNLNEFNSLLLDRKNFDRVQKSAPEASKSTTDHTLIDKPFFSPTEDVFDVFLFTSPETTRRQAESAVKDKPASDTVPEYILDYLDQIPPPLAIQSERPISPTINLTSPRNLTEEAKKQNSSEPVPTSNTSLSSSLPLLSPPVPQTSSEVHQTSQTPQMYSSLTLQSNLLTSSLTTPWKDVIVDLFRQRNSTQCAPFSGVISSFTRMNQENLQVKRELKTKSLLKSPIIDSPKRAPTTDVEKLKQRIETLEANEKIFKALNYDIFVQLKREVMESKKKCKEAREHSAKAEEHRLKADKALHKAELKNKQLKDENHHLKETIHSYKDREKQIISRDLAFKSVIDDLTMEVENLKRVEEDQRRKNEELLHRNEQMVHQIKNSLKEINDLNTIIDLLQFSSNPASLRDSSEKVSSVFTSTPGGPPDFLSPPSNNRAPSNVDTTVSFPSSVKVTPKNALSRSPSFPGSALEFDRLRSSTSANGPSTSRQWVPTAPQKNSKKRASSLLTLGRRPVSPLSTPVLSPLISPHNHNNNNNNNNRSPLPPSALSEIPSSPTLQTHHGIHSNNTETTNNSTTSTTTTSTTPTNSQATPSNISGRSGVATTHTNSRMVSSSDGVSNSLVNSTVRSVPGRSAQESHVRPPFNKSHSTIVLLETSPSVEKEQSDPPTLSYYPAMSFKPPKYLMGRMITGHTQGLNSLSFSDCGTRLVSSGGDSLVKLWSVEDGQELRVFRGPTKPVLDSKISKDLELILGCSSDFSVTVWRNEDPIQTFQTFQHSGKVTSGVFLRSDAVVTASHDRTIKRWDIATGECPSTISCGSFCNTVVATESFFTSGHFDRSVRFYDPSSGKLIHKSEIHQMPITSLCLSHDGNSVLTNSKDNTLKQIDIRTFRQMGMQFAHPNYFNSCNFGSNACFSDDGKIIIAGSGRGSIFGWNTTNGLLDFLLTPTTSSSPVVCCTSTSHSKHTPLATSLQNSIIFWEHRTIDKR
eukprot:TRINITY_DN876_c0_g1_i1.p1 TRINITY_DN876_c0_g1~~TRINITY_DN876_c0_g1_i1.p1  ORF type:complete len:992 (+),score=211.75 TRINITY_DN876_c0_g1_i1:44-3019(+)